MANKKEEKEVEFVFCDKCKEEAEKLKIQLRKTKQAIFLRGRKFKKK